MMGGETWIDIKDTDGYYQVSNLGRVRSFRKYFGRDGRLPEPRFLSPYLNKKRGYYYVSIELPQRKNWSLHRLVAEHFIENPEKKPQVNHLNCDKKDNRVANLEWCTSRENIHHAIANGKIDPHAWKPSYRVKITQDKADRIREMRGVFYYREIAEIFGVKYSTIAHIMTNRRWANGNNTSK